MSETSTKWGFGVYVTILAAILSAAAGVYFQSFGGIFGATRRVCYDPAVVGLLIGGAVVALLLVFVLKRSGLASAIAAAAPGVALLFFIHKCYWYVSDVFVAIDEKGFDQKFIVFVSLAVAAFVIGELAVYCPKFAKKKA